MKTLEIGQKAPDFNLNGKSLKDYFGKKLILYFYPKDNTSGCTAQACNIRDNYTQLKAKGYEVIGISTDNEKSHHNFKEKYQLPFELIADTEKNLSKDYGVWGQKKMYGKTYEGIVRTTFIINETGFIEKIINKVDTKNHSNQILLEMEK